MDKFIKNIIEEKFESKSQQRYFFAKANDKTLSKKERAKWKKWAEEFSDETDYEEIPDKVKKEAEELLLGKNEKEVEVDEIVDELGNIGRDKTPTDAPAKGITQKRTTDQVVKTSAGQMGNHGIGGMKGGTHTTQWASESDNSKALGSDTMEKDMSYDEALKYFMGDLGLDEKEAEEKMADLGYDKKLAKRDDDKVRLVENPKVFIERYIDEVILNKQEVEELIDDKEKEINPIIQKQLTTLKKVMKNNGLSVKDILKYLKDNE